MKEQQQDLKTELTHQQCIGQSASEAEAAV
jgi:hypothetical protein